MARKWNLFFHRIFAVLSGRQQARNGQTRRLAGIRSLVPGIYVLLAVVVAVVCGFATQNLVRAIVPATDGQSIAQTSPQPSEALSEAEQAEQIAREHYSTGRFNEAAAVFLQAAQRYESQGDALRQAITLSNLSLTYQQLGQWDDADREIQAALKLENHPEIDRSPIWQSALAQILDIRGSLELARGQAEQAINTWQHTTAIYQQLGKPDQAAESQINQARALQSLGLYNRAIVLLEEALDAFKPPEQAASLLDGLEENSDSPLEETLNDLGENIAVTLEETQSPGTCAIFLSEDIPVILQERLKALSPSPITVVALQSLGEVLQVVGSLRQADAVLQHSLKLAQSPEAIANAELNLGNVRRAKAIANLRLNNMTIEDAVAQLQRTNQLSKIDQVLQCRQIEAAEKFDKQTRTALEYYQKAAYSSASTKLQTQAQLNHLSLLIDKQQWTQPESAISEIEASIDRLPLSRAAIDARLNLAQSWMRLAKVETGALAFNSSTSLQKAEQLLQTAQEQASLLKDEQAESYALGLLGQVYEQNQQLDQAEVVTQQALEKVRGLSSANLPYRVNDTDLAYRWHQQRGRIYRGQRDMEKAIEAYDEAVKILQNRLRMDVASSNLDYQFSFREDAEPVYRGLLDLLLQDPTQKHLQQTRDVIASLLETELTSFLQEPCEVVTPEEIDRVIDDRDLKTAVIYPIILPDRLELISKFPGDDQLYHYPAIPMEREVILEKVKTLQLALEEDYTFVEVQEASQEFYQWIVQPVEEKIAEENIEVDTLVFALDRSLQNIPMAALYDGNQYLIEKYAISEILGLRLEGRIAPLHEQEQLRVLAAGLSIIPENAPEDVRLNFLPLTQVPNELEALENTGISVTTILDSNFTRSNFNARLNQDTFPIIHLATHGIFSVDPEETFLLTYGNKFDDVKIEVNELASLFRVRGQIRPDAIELLVLNACETAAGDDSATLGIAGTAVRAGARSVIASLWTLGDAPSVEFTRHFYENLKATEKISKAEALRRAQRSLMDNPLYEHPRYWAPYILAGNWL